MDSETPWPRKGDQLFTEDGHWFHSACLGWSRDEWHGYAEGYRRAAEIVVEQVMKTHYGIDYLGYPVVFLYRQYLEVSLKSLLRLGTSLHGIDDTLSLGHPLSPLWKRLRPLIQRAWPDAPAEGLDAVEEIRSAIRSQRPSIDSVSLSGRQSRATLSADSREYQSGPNGSRDGTRRRVPGCLRHGFSALPGDQAGNGEQVNRKSEFHRVQNRHVLGARVRRHSPRSRHAPTVVRFSSRPFWSRGERFRPEFRNELLENTLL